MNKKRISVLLIMLTVLVIIVIFALITLSGNVNKKEIKVGYVCTGSIDEEGWNGTNIRAVKSACDKLEINVIIKENVREFTGECEKAVNELIDSGASMIMLNSNSYVEELGNIIDDNSEILFYVNYSEDSRKGNVTTYFARMYQARYLSGILAGMKTQSNKIGYVAAMNTSEVNRGINAFALGARSVNPDVQVVVAFTESWDNEKLEKEAVHNLVEKENIDVVSYHQNRPYTIDAAEEEGIFSIGYHEAFKGYSDKYLTSVTADWEIVYIDILKEYMQGRSSTTTHYWIGIEKDAVMLSEYSDEVSDDIRKKIEDAKLKMKFKDVFSGEIYDNEGVLRCEENESLSDDMLIHKFDWFVQGVSFLDKDGDGI